MPTHAETARFRRDYQRLTRQEKDAFKAALVDFIHDLREGRFRKGLRVKGVQGSTGIFELTWAGNGRATFQYGPPVVEGEPHIIWRRCGTHEVLSDP